MKRFRIDLADLACADNLALAAWKAARGKRQRGEVRRFFAQFDESIRRLRHDILAGSAPCGEYRSFLIHDPKERRIHAACFPDRVLQHAILNLAEPVFERTLVPSSYACRPGLGVHRAIRHAQRNLRLQLKENVQINRSERGVTYCGARVLRGSLRLSARKKARYCQGREQWEAAWCEGAIDALTLQRGYAAVLAPTLHCDSLSWRIRQLEIHPSRYSDE
ncbi:MAG: hypothetical protein NFW04_11730 [Candidatus Accumulibacter sp.]|uniref:hypothetical protein n=1 Tax=Accumulibacter sp. TaxID=2053492 RepID=UPI0025F73CB2|nr:hypothetical protein [Accumulibacter sp.]MCM8599309.1 hypothetical protein [Accumulibacter sp.]MCM8663403.1 hypothetical protein [Accumulibacter sp.]